MDWSIVVAVVIFVAVAAGRAYFQSRRQQRLFGSQGLAPRSLPSVEELSRRSFGAKQATDDSTQRVRLLSWAEDDQRPDFERARARDPYFNEAAVLVSVERAYGQWVESGQLEAVTAAPGAREVLASRTVGPGVITDLIVGPARILAVSADENWINIEVLFVALLVERGAPTEWHEVWALRRRPNTGEPWELVVIKEIATGPVGGPPQREASRAVAPNLEPSDSSLVARAQEILRGVEGCLHGQQAPLLTSTFRARIRLLAARSARTGVALPLLSGTVSHAHELARTTRPEALHLWVEGRVQHGSPFAERWILRADDAGLRLWQVRGT